MEVPWPLKVFSVLEDMPHHFLIIKDLIMNVLIDFVLKGLLLLHSTLWLLRDVFYQTRDLFISLSGNDGRKQSVYNKNLPAMLERMGNLECLR